MRGALPKIVRAILVAVAMATLAQSFAACGGEAMVTVAPAPTRTPTPTPLPEG